MHLVLEVICSSIDMDIANSCMILLENTTAWCLNVTTWYVTLTLHLSVLGFVTTLECCYVTT